MGPGGIRPDGLKPGGSIGPAKKSGLEPAGKSFKDILSDSIQEVNELQKEAEAMADALATGETDNVDEVLVAARKAELAFDLLMQIRNKLVDAYEEISRMRV
jgi:flagellar hook-basal body complex protein FliE